MFKNYIFLVVLILSSCCSDNPIKCAYNDASRIEYQSDPLFMDYWQTPFETWFRGKGDCEDIAFYLQHLLNNQNIESDVVFGSIKGNNSPTHAWVEINKDGNVLILDPTAKLYTTRKILQKYNKNIYKKVEDSYYINFAFKTYLKRNKKAYSSCYISDMTK